MRLKPHRLKQQRYVLQLRERTGPRENDTGDAGEADSAYRASCDDGYAGTRADGHAGPNARQGANTAFFFWDGRNRQVPKFPRNEDKPRCGVCVLGPTWMA